MGYQIWVSVIPLSFFPTFFHVLTYQCADDVHFPLFFLLSYCIYILRGHTSTIRCLRVLHNRPIAVSGSRDTTLRVWDVQRGRLLRTLTGHDESVRCLDVCGNRAVSGSYDCTCRVSISHISMVFVVCGVIVNLTICFFLS